MLRNDVMLCSGSFYIQLHDDFKTSNIYSMEMMNLDVFVLKDFTYTELS